MCALVPQKPKLLTPARQGTSLWPPFDELGVDEEGTAGEVDARVGGLEVKGRRNLVMAEGQHDLEDARDSGRRGRMAEIALDRAKGAIVPVAA